MPPSETATKALSGNGKDEPGSESDYGSDFDEEALINLTGLDQPQSLILESIEDPPPSLTPVQTVRIPKATDLVSRSPLRPRTRRFCDENGIILEVPDPTGPLREASVEVEYDEANRNTFRARRDADRNRSEYQTLGPDLEQPTDDSRSPLQRFRTAPKKTLSVTDLVSPAWCELQYFYNLAKFGRVKKTPAMYQGSSVHKVLEEEVHIAVPVETVTREDNFALRIWNIIQGLRTLRSTGLTREFEVWGEIEGQIVNGVIDELSHTCPDKALEAELGVADDSRSISYKKKDINPAANQSTMLNFVSRASDVKGKAEAVAKRVYLTDIKTRGSKRIPTDEASLRPTYMQLMIYRRLLTGMINQAVNPIDVFRRYAVNGEDPFSDVFIAQIGSAEFNFHSSPTSVTDASVKFNSTQDSMDELLSHNSLFKLWSLMVEELSQTFVSFPNNDSSTTFSLSPILQAEFRSQSSGEIIGRKLFINDERKIETYLRDEMAWWKGERAVRGVEVEEAFKCRICTFAEKCKWREDKVEEGLRKARLRAEERKKSVV